MSVEAAQLFFSMLSFVAIAGIVLVIVLRMLSSRSTVAEEYGRAIADSSLWLAFVVAAVCMFGSLYFSEVAHFVPCRYCWYQRIAMYPLAVILLVAAIRGDRGARWYVLPLAVIGAATSTYHYLLEWKPEIEGGSCSAVGPSCADVWFREFGFVTLAFMALVGFSTIITLLFVRYPERLEPSS